jgi:hypothetical protein
MVSAVEKRFRVVEVLADNRHRTIDSDLALGTARSSVALFRQLDPERKVIIEPADVCEDAAVNSLQLAMS